jgi:hypothetical protein
MTVGFMGEAERDRIMSFILLVKEKPGLIFPERVDFQGARALLMGYVIGLGRQSIDIN